MPLNVREHVETLAAYSAHSGSHLGFVYISFFMNEDIKMYKCVRIFRVKINILWFVTFLLCFMTLI